MQQSNSFTLEDSSQIKSYTPKNTVNLNSSNSEVAKHTLFYVLERIFMSKLIEIL